MFIKLGGTSSTHIKGESTDAKHAGEIDVMSFSIGASRAPAGGGLQQQGKAEFHDFSFVMAVDLATPKILELVATGKALDQAILTARSAGTEFASEFLKWTFSNLIFTGLSEAMSQADDRGAQEVSFAYQKVRLDYSLVNPKTGSSTTSSFEFDLVNQRA